MNDSQKITAIELKDSMSWREIARKLDLPKSTVSDFLRESNRYPGSDQPKVLFFDIETAPSITMAFSRFKAFASPDHVLQEPYLLLYGYAWGATGEVKTDSILMDWKRGYITEENNDILLTERAWELLDEADIVIAHNAKFDTQTMNQQFVKYDLPPPSSYKVVCTLQGLKKAFNLPSNSLAASTQFFDIERKLDNSGISLWKGCMEMDVESFNEMSTYCKGDVAALQSLYNKILPYFPSHPNVAHYYDDDKMRCRRCGSDKMVAMDDSHMYTNVSKFQAYRCGDCGGINRDRTNAHNKEKMKNILM